MIERTTLVFSFIAVSFIMSGIKVNLILNNPIFFRFQKES